MKKITLLLLLVAMTSIAQIKGNKTIVTKTFDVGNLQNLKINLYAKVTIDQTMTESLSITADENLFAFIKKEVVDNTLHLGQVEWISPSTDIIIKIGAPQLKSVEQGTHDKTVVNVDNNNLNILAPIGNITLIGKTKQLRVGAELANIDASQLIADEVFIDLWSRGKVILNPKKLLVGKVSNDGMLYFIKSPQILNVKTNKNGQVMAFENKNQLQNPKAKYINFKIKNNSNNRHDFYVIGPKQDGTSFSYGFPMMPYAKRQENWTIGTKIYEENSLGLKKLLVKITAEDEDRVVDLFKE